MRTYWVAYCNDGVPLFDVERFTRAEAIKDLKNAYRFDYEESEVAADYNDYYIEKFTENDYECICHGEEHFKMTIGPRGGVNAKKIKQI